MNSFWAVFKRELKSYFATPLAYVFLVIFLFFAGYLAFNKQGFFDARQADMQAFFVNLPLLFIFMVPATAMRLWAEERKVGSIELLFTLPVTITQAVLGKFFAAWLFLGIALALTFPMVITVAYLGDPDGGLIATGYIGSFLVAGAFLAIGTFFSAVSKNQVIAFVLSVVACAVLVFAGMPTTLNYISTLGPEPLVIVCVILIQAGVLAAIEYFLFALIKNRVIAYVVSGVALVVLVFISGPLMYNYLVTFLPAGLVGAVEGMSLQEHFDALQRGVVQFRDIAYFVLLIVGWVAASTIVLDERKAS